MTYLILGGNGQLGSEWNVALSGEEKNVYSFNSAELDITNYGAVKAVIAKIHPDIIINCAAYTKVDEAEEDRKKSEMINHLAVAILSKVCAYEGIKLVHYSTDYVFSGEVQDQREFPDGYPENAVKNPVNHYGKTKLNGELAIQQSGASHLILRVSWLCGAYGNNFVKTMLRLVQERDTVSVVNDQFGAPTYCSEVVEQTMKLLENEQEGVFHLGSEGIISWYDFARRIFELSGVDVKVKEVSSTEFKTKAKRPHFSKLNTTKVEQALNAKSLHWETGLDQLLKTINL